MADLQKTPLHAAHVAAGAKLVDFAGWHMPVQYQGILAEHRAVREGAGLFDVSHMGEIDFQGPGALAVVQGLVSNDVSKLVDGQALYTVTCLPSGGIVDDCIVYRRAADDLRIVVNASNIAKDAAHFREYADFAGGVDARGACEIVDRSPETALIAVQGPQARALCAKLGGENLLELGNFHFGPGELAGVPVVAARTGYTGEDGYELFVDAKDGGASASALWNALIEAGAAPCGLGARDTLRLEARLSLYGNDIDETTTPYEAGLGWVVKPKASDFIGREALLAQKREGVDRKLVGFVVEGKGTARGGWSVASGEGPDAPVLDETRYRVTSGAPAPTVGGSIGLAYVPATMSEPGTTLWLRSRHKTITAKIVKGPFYKRPQ
ncbi:glycine cleavage system aminomethyltransferase GcvT [Pseudenhygromyxa sp. WMMC2535]|uniref:glycine cleavage system aminomethyltransferase GcvT n=1 Tax=Pseudenhygromyxa sp. WMMC2535 TaxID=2712867 RepID=UPI001551828C|nr:glycine cleavage system aminomethyltransferase GcvT [Pseudenhygromyxa sp. WMMC2535]NVB41160.1 glycine cleavage system aminomethyltransferase GcvT [Pseudenhygromyxa sp. WMMC2535]